jgi:hypothetical protein
VIAVSCQGDGRVGDAGDAFGDHALDFALPPFAIGFLISRCSAASTRPWPGRGEAVSYILGSRTSSTGGIVLGCTEIPLLVRLEDSPVAGFDTTEIRARRAVEWALEDLA